jgi:hypothetical protein
MTATSAVRFDLTDINAGTAAIATLAFSLNDKIAFGVVGNEMVVFKVRI